jgi:hypothetical protein
MIKRLPGIAVAVLAISIAPRLSAVTQSQTVLIQNYGGQYSGQSTSQSSRQWSGQYTDRWSGQYLGQRAAPLNNRDLLNAGPKPVDGRGALNGSIDGSGYPDPFAGNDRIDSLGAPAASMPCWSIYNGAGC